MKPITNTQMNEPESNNEEDQDPQNNQTWKQAAWFIGLWLGSLTFFLIATKGVKAFWGLFF